MATTADRERQTAIATAIGDATLPRPSMARLPASLIPQRTNTSLTLHRSQPLLDALNTMIQFELDELRRDLAPGRYNLINPLNPPTSNLFDQLTNAISAAHYQERYR